MIAQLTHGRIQARTTEPATPADRGRLSEACHRIRLIIREMNYTSRRLVELQAPWGVDKQWHRK